MKITFITGHLCKERHALLNELALDLGEQGAQVTVLTGFPSRRISDEVRQYYLSHPIERISENVVVKRIGSKKGEGKSLFMRMIKYYFLTRKLYKEALKTETDIYYLYSSPFFLGYIGTKLQKKAPTLYNAQDLFPDTLVHTKGMSQKNLLIRYFKNRETDVYQKNTHIVTISNEMKKTIVLNGADERKVSVIYNWADVEKLHHVKREENRYFDEFKIDRSKFIVSYAGDLGLFQGWDVILDSAAIIQKQFKDIEFVFIGSGSYKERILKRITEENLNNIRVFPLQPAERLSEVYSIGDIELLPIEKGITKMALPSKSGVIMATGSPILAIVDEGSDIYSIVEENNIGFSVIPGSVDNLVEKIIEAYKAKDELESYGINAKNFARENYSRKKQTKKYFMKMKESVYGQL